MIQENTNPSPQITAVVSPPPVHILGVEPRDVDKMQAVDYSKFIALIAFRGFTTAATGIGITKIWQQGGNVYVQAELSGYVGAPSYSSAYQIIKIAKSHLSQTGAITFRLLDQSGKERAVVSQDITP